MTKHKTCDKITYANATMAQMVEHILGKDEVIGSIPISSSKKTSNPLGLLFLFDKLKRASLEALFLYLAFFFVFALGFVDHL